MNLAYFKKLLEYDYWANEKFLNSLEATPSPAPEALKKMSHVLLAKNVWMGRLMELPARDLEGSLTLEEARKLNRELGEKMAAYLSDLKESQLSEKVIYKNAKGAVFETVLSDILAHLVNHSSYHRGQIAALINRSGGPVTYGDYIAYVREMDAKQ
jgi:uncharacterized damage-inducible protein DinB